MISLLVLNIVSLEIFIKGTNFFPFILINLSRLWSWENTNFKNHLWCGRFSANKYYLSYVQVLTFMMNLSVAIMCYSLLQVYAAYFRLPCDINSSKVKRMFCSLKIYDEQNCIVLTVLTMLCITCLIFKSHDFVAFAINFQCIFTLCQIS